MRGKGCLGPGETQCLRREECCRYSSRRSLVEPDCRTCASSYLRDGCYGPIPLLVTRHGDNGRPQTEYGRACSRLLGASSSGHLLSVADDEMAGQFDGFEGFVGLGAKREQVVRRLRSAPAARTMARSS